MYNKLQFNQTRVNFDSTIIVTEAQINRAIDALNNTSRLINNLNQDCLAKDDGGLVFINDNTNNTTIRDLWVEVNSARTMLSHIINIQTITLGK